MDESKREAYIDCVLEKNEREEDCPIRRVLKVLSGQWRPQIIYTLYKHPACRFGQLQKAMPRVTNAVLTTTLRELERSGIVQRTQFNEVPPHVEYSLTDKGCALLPIFYEMTVWGEKYLGDEGMLER